MLLRTTSIAAPGVASFTALLLSTVVIACAGAAITAAASTAAGSARRASRVSRTHGTSRYSTPECARESARPAGGLREAATGLREDARAPAFGRGPACSVAKRQRYLTMITPFMPTPLWIEHT